MQRLIHKRPTSLMTVESNSFKSTLFKTATATVRFIVPERSLAMTSPPTLNWYSTIMETGVGKQEMNWLALKRTTKTGVQTR